MADTGDLGAGLQRLLAAVEPDRTASVESYRPLTGGYSRISGKADVRWGDGSTESFLLRADPVEGDGVFMSDRDDEWALTVALAAAGQRTVAIPRPRWFDADGAYFGTKCMVIEFRPGTPMQALLQDAGAVDALTDTFVDTAVKIHQTPLDALPSTMRRPADWDADIDEAIELYARTEGAILDASPMMRFAAAWLQSHRPEPLPLGLVHGDLQPGNVLVAEGEEPLMIDWEFARIGDPREDLGYYSQIPMPPNVYGRAPERFLERYRAATGFPESAVNPDTVRYFLLVSMARPLGQMAMATDRLARGGRGGAMATYLINAVSHQWSLFLDATRNVVSGNTGART